MHTIRKQIPCITLIVFSMALGAAGQAVPSAIPSPEHVVVVVEENHGYSQIIGSSQAPYINTL